MPILGYGLGSWGLGPWGSTPATVSLASVQVLDTNTVRVTLLGEARHGSGYILGDALDPRTWSLVRQDTGAAFTILAVRRVVDGVYDLRTLELLAEYRILHRVSTTALMSMSGAPLSPPTFLDFPGLAQADHHAGLHASRPGDRDLAAPPTPGLASGASTESVGGALVITSGGDYAEEEGEALLRKLILRRLTTKKGEFKHLPEYGLGLDEKEPVPLSDLALLKAEIEQQVMREPEVEDVNADLSLDTSSGVLYLSLRCTRRVTGQQFVVGTLLPSGLVAL